MSYAVSITDNKALFLENLYGHHLCNLTTKANAKKKKK
jgi:hypothetical protein